MLRRLMARRASSAPESVVRRIMEDVRNHEGAAEQSDDIAVLAIRYDGAANGSFRRIYPEMGLISAYTDLSNPSKPS